MARCHAKRRGDEIIQSITCRFYTSSELTNVCIPYHDYYNRIVADFANKKVGA